MIKAMLDCTNMDDEEMERLTQEQEYYISTVVKEVINQGEILKKGIDELLQKGEIEAAAKLTDEETYIKAEQWSTELEYFKRVCRIEKYQGICQEKSVSEVAEIYQKVIFYLRRVEFGFEKKYLDEFLQFMESRQLPCEYLLTVLEHKEISDDFAVGCRLADLFLTEEKVEYARSMITWLEQRQKA